MGRRGVLQPGPRGHLRVDRGSAPGGAGVLVRAARATRRGSGCCRSTSTSGSWAATRSCSRASTGSPSVTPATPRRSCTSCRNGPSRRSARVNLSPAETRRTIAHGKLSMGDPDFESLMISDPPRHGQIRNIMMKSLRPSLVRSPEAPHRRDHRRVPRPDRARRRGRLRDDGRPDPGRADDRAHRRAAGHAGAVHRDGIGPDAGHHHQPEHGSGRGPADQSAWSANSTTTAGELLADRKASGAEGDDLVSCIARSEHDGGPVPLGMAISFIHTFVNAGRDDEVAAVVHHAAPGPAS